MHEKHNLALKNSILYYFAFTGEMTSLRESEEKYRQQYAEASHREKILVRRLASKEQELQEYVVSSVEC